MAADDATTSATTDATASSSVSPKAKTGNDIKEVVVHPLVLLSAADHYHRVARNTQRRVVGVLLGSVSRGKVDACNSFAVPFEEDRKNPAVFYLDHNYLENMLGMFRKINARERVVGFYSTGPQIRPNDIRIHALMKRFVQIAPGVPPPVFVIVDVRPDRTSSPTTAYRTVEDDGGPTTTSSSSGGNSKEIFAHVPSTVGAAEAEEVGVEHLLRDINDPTVSTVASLVRAKLSGLESLAERLRETEDYLTKVADGTHARPNREILNNAQTILNLLPNLNVDELVRSIYVKTNDLHMVIYLSSLIRSVMALHDLVNNKIKYNEEESAENNNNSNNNNNNGRTTSSSSDDEEKKDDSAATGDAEKKEGAEKNKK